jgi:cytochrome c5
LQQEGGSTSGTSTNAHPRRSAPEAEKSAAVSGAEVYQAHCASCHAEGVAGAPKTGDKDAWSGKIASGIDQMVQNSINGIGTMPAKGGNPNLRDEDVRAAVEYMVEQSR